MVQEKRLTPDYIFEASWEVCNKVGGIYTVLSTKAKTLQSLFQDRILFIGPDLWQHTSNPDFIESKSLFKEWRTHALESDQLKVRIGRWNIPGDPITILVDFKPFSSEKNDLYFRMWNSFGVDSIKAYGDYDESCVFAYACGLVIESFCNFNQLQDQHVIAHFNEWMLGMGALHVKEKLPYAGTLFTTHATSIGRSIAGNNKPLYEFLTAYNGDQMAQELHMEAKHSIEKQTAANVDCFTTVSKITAKECEQLLACKPDVVTPNGFENNFVPKGPSYTRKRNVARRALLNVVRRLTGENIDDNALMIATSGRYEYKNKGIDVFIESMNKLRSAPGQKPILAFILVPAWIKGPRLDLQERLKESETNSAPLPEPYYTHELMEPWNDKVCGYLNCLNFNNSPSDRVKIIFIPSYLTGDDGILNKTYYDLLIGMDLTVFPSYYEPWGYTPLESIAFGIPTITTDLAGFGIWAMEECKTNDLYEGVEVLERTENNYFEITENIKDTVIEFSQSSEEENLKIRKAAAELSNKASWSYFIEYYLEAYDIALKKAKLRHKIDSFK